jgi:phage N-6-adenine-methyltransferase
MISHQISTTRYEIHPRCDDTQRSRQVDASILRRPTEQEIAWRGTRPPDLPAPPPEPEPEDEAPDAFYTFWSTHTGPVPDLPLELWRLVWLDGYIYQGETPGGGLLFVHESGSVLETSHPDLCDRYSWEPESDPEPIPFPTSRITLSEAQRVRDALEDQGWIVASHDRGYQLTRGDQSITVADEAGLIGVLETGAPDGGYDRDEWYTPQRVITHAWDAMGRIDLDPASNEEAQEVVQAATYYTKADNGLAQSWHGRVWLNPPYSQPAPWVDKTIAEWEAGTIEQAILLVNDQTDAQWYQRLLSAASVVCFLGQRVRFWHPERRGETPRQGQTVFYFGDRADRFVAIFRPLGALMVGYPEAIETSIELAPPERVERGG